MASQDYTIELLLKANNQLSGELTKIQGQIDKLDKQVNQTSESVNTAFSKIGSIIKQGAIVGAIYKIGQSIRDLTSAFEPVENSFYRLSETAGIVGEDMLQAMRNASLGTVSDFDLMSAANKAYSLGVVSSIDDMTTLMEIARLKGQAMGRTMEEALGDIMTGLGRASPLILDNLGIVVKQGEAQEKYAEEIGKTVSQLTEEEKKQALVNAVVEQGKKELEAAGEVPMTMQERFAQLQAQIQNMAVVIGQQVAPAINDFFEQLGTDLKTTQSDIVDKVTGVLRAFINGVRTIYNVIISIAKVAQGGVFGILNGILSKTSEVINKVIDRINQFTEKVNAKLGTSIGKIGQVTIGGVVGASEDYFKIWKDTISDVKSDWIDFGADLIIQQDKVTKSVKNTTKQMGELTNTMNGVGGGGKGGSKTSDAIKEIRNQYELLTYNVDEQYKKIQELNKERKEGYDELADKFKEADKNVKDLSKSVGDLKQKLADLNKDETSDIASEFVNARKELQKMERDYAGIGEVAKQYSLDYLENYQHGGIGKYDIDALIQYKKYSDEMASVYDGLNDSERKAMDEQIAYQEWYQSLNGIEKIKEDYRIKREEIQGELNEKMAALRTEELKRAEIEKQMAQYRKEWLATLDVEIKKRIAMYTEKMNYEKQYMEQLEIDQKRQVEMYNELIRKAKELAKARSEAGGPTGGTRANGGPVYSGQSYLVGENGPELFIPSQNGSITRNEDLGRGQEFTINVNMGGVVVNDGQDTQQMAEEIANTITRQLELYKKGIY